MEQTSTYCPEDNKLRLYVGRVPRDEYETLRAQGWTSTPKQDCDFVAMWTPAREDTALEYSGGVLEDEDQSPQDRAADRAERFSGYRDKRTDEATGKADAYDAGPAVHGYQSAALAERRAARHDMQASRAVNLWSKAEYWQQRTAGVISHALHVSAPGVRMGRIKELEAEIRKAQAGMDEYRASFARWRKVAGMTDPAEQSAAALRACCDEHSYDYKHPRPEQVKNAHILASGSSLYTLLNMGDGAYGEPITGAEACALYLASHTDPEGEAWAACSWVRWLRHYELRLAYELQMLEAQGGRAAFVEMEPGGWIGKYQVQKVNKSPATGRVVSVAIMIMDHGPYGNGEYKERPVTMNVERLKAEVYRAPTDEERAAFADAKKAGKKAAAVAKKAAPAAPSLCNPTNEDAERLQLVWNEQAKREKEYDADKPHPVIYTTQAAYSANLKAGGSCETYDITGGGNRSRANWRAGDFPTVAKVRGQRRQVVVLTDKPQKPFPAVVWEDPRPATRAEVVSKIVQLDQAVRRVFNGVGHYLENLSTEEQQLFGRARLVGLAHVQSSCQWGLTEEGYKLAREAAAAEGVQP
jgi:hypothetical protein